MIGIFVLRLSFLLCLGPSVPSQPQKLLEESTPFLSFIGFRVLFIVGRGGVTRGPFHSSRSQSSIDNDSV